MFHFLTAITQKSAAVLVASVASAFGFFAQPNTIVITPPPQIAVLPAPTSTEPAQQISTTTASAAISTRVDEPTSTVHAGPPPPLPQKADVAEKIKTAEPKPPPPKPKEEPAQPKPISAPAPHTWTARAVLDRTTSTLAQAGDGAYRLSFRTATENSGFDWDLGTATIGGTASIPKFDVSFSCDPWPTPAPAGSPDLNPSFALDTSYTCTVTLTDSTSKKENKDFSFKTGTGRLIARASNLDTMLNSNESANGFVFDNQSLVPITVTGITFDVSFTALKTLSPIMLRIIDPSTESTLAEYPLQNLPTDPSKTYTHGTTGMNASLSFVVKPGYQRLLPVKVFGVDMLPPVGVDPEVKVTLRTVTTDRSDVPTTLFSPIIDWSCISFELNKTAQATPNERNCR